MPRQRQQYTLWYIWGPIGNNVSAYLSIHYHVTVAPYSNNLPLAPPTDEATTRIRTNMSAFDSSRGKVMFVH